MSLTDLSVMMSQRCAEVLAAFCIPEIHRGHLASWGIHRTGKRDDYITAFKSAFGSNRSTLKWTVENTAIGLTARPEKALFKGHIIPHGLVEEAKVQLKNDRLPKGAISEFVRPSANAKGDVEGMRCVTEKVRDGKGKFIFYGQELNPGGLLKIGRSTKGGLSTELDWWLSRHSWVVRYPSATGRLLWAVPIGTEGDVKQMEFDFRKKFDQFGYILNHGVRHGTESFHLVGDVQRIALEMAALSDQHLTSMPLMTNSNFYPLTF
jgi:hypothetical protein